MKKILLSIGLVLLCAVGFSQQTKNVTDSTRKLYVITSTGDTLVVMNSRLTKVNGFTKLEFLYDSVSFTNVNLTSTQIVAGLGYQPAYTPDWNAGPGSINSIYNKPNLFSGQYVDLTGAPTVLSQFGNDADFITSYGSNVLTNKSGDISQWTNNVGYLSTPGGTTLQYIDGTGLLQVWHQPDWNAYGTPREILNKPTKLSDFYNDSAFMSSATPAYLTNKTGNISQWTNNSGYLTNIISSQVITALGYTPYNNSNPASYISGITGSQVNTALGFTPYNSSNPSSYISGITGSDVTTALGFTPYNSTNPSGYISSVTSSAVTSALGFTPINPNGISSQYFRGDGSKATFPTVYSFSGLASQYTKGDGTYSSLSAVATSGAYTDLSGKPSLATVATSGSYNDLSNKPTIPSVVVTSNDGVTRSITGTTYTISNTQGARVYYTVEVSCTASIGSSASGSVLFQYSINGGSTWIDGGEVKNSNVVTLAIVLNSVNTQRGIISYEVPANALCRMTQTLTGTTTITYIRGGEKLYN